MTADFTSALFLGLRHPSHDFNDWTDLTTGRPAAVAETAATRTVAAELAHWQGAQSGLLTRSSLHALIDVLVTATSNGGRIVIDEFAYPISRWAAAIAKAHGAEVGVFRHRNPDDAARIVRKHRGSGHLVIVTDGWCPGCMRPSPLRELAELTGRAGASLIVDDSLAAGVLGRRSSSRSKLGTGGQGTPAWLGMDHREIVWVASLAKGFGAPVAAVTGPHRRLRVVRRCGPTRTHSSPPSHTDVAALQACLANTGLNHRRHQLERHVDRVRHGLEAIGRRPVGLHFPVVALDQTRADAEDLQRSLGQQGIAVLLVERRCVGRISVEFCLRADHHTDEITRLLEAIRRAPRGRPG